MVKIFIEKIKSEIESQEVLLLFDCLTYFMLAFNKKFFKFFKEEINFDEKSATKLISIWKRMNIDLEDECDKTGEICLSASEKRHIRKVVKGYIKSK